VTVLFTADGVVAVVDRVHAAIAPVAPVNVDFPDACVAALPVPLPPTGSDAGTRLAMSAGVAAAGAALVGASRWSRLRRRRVAS
jgi:hypothetical protein